MIDGLKALLLEKGRQLVRCFGDPNHIKVIECYEHDKKYHKQNELYIYDTKKLAKLICTVSRIWRRMCQQQAHDLHVMLGGGVAQGSLTTGYL